METPFVLVIFGATGDLARHKLIPALFSLFKQKKLPEDFFIIGFARRHFTDNAFSDLFADVQKEDREVWNAFVEHLFYQQGLFDEKDGYEKLIIKLAEFDKRLNACITRIFYFATPPNNYNTILDLLSITKLSEGCGQGSSKWTKIAIEKPFGKDLETAKMLDQKLSDIFEERQIFRVDHYLGKETIQNMLVFRFANSIFEPIWNKEYIDHVQITWAEEKGIEGRGNFYDGVGMLRDVAQNHLMQFVAAVAMESPKSFSKEGVRDARAEAIKAITATDEKQKHIMVRAQYEGYRSEPGVSPMSQTETFVAMKLYVNTPRFSHVPFYLRAGKKMPKHTAEISIIFKQTCHLLFKEIGCPEEGNILTFRIQPNEGITLHVIAKNPGSVLSLGNVDMKFTYADKFKDQGIDAYQKVLVDIFSGDQMLFNRSDELASSWQLITDILHVWEKESNIRIYPSGTWGPKEAAELIENDGRKWIE